MKRPLEKISHKNVVEGDAFVLRDMSGVGDSRTRRSRECWRFISPASIKVDRISSAAEPRTWSSAATHEKPEHHGLVSIEARYSERQFLAAVGA
jgi:hypothetical protein